MSLWFFVGQMALLELCPYLNFWNGWDYFGSGAVIYVWRSVAPLASVDGLCFVDANCLVDGVYTIKVAWCLV